HGPVLRGHEGLDLALGVDDEAPRDRLYAPGGEPALDLLPQERRQTVADETIEDAAGLLGVDLLEVDLAGTIEGRLDRPLGDLVERDAVDLLLGERQLLGQVSSGCLPFPGGCRRAIPRV